MERCCSCVCNHASPVSPEIERSKEARGVQSISAGGLARPEVLQSLSCESGRPALFAREKENGVQQGRSTRTTPPITNEAFTD